MTCREVAELLIDYVSGELPPEVVEHLREHFKLCPPCVTYMETYQITIRLTRQLPDVPPPPELIERLKASLEETGNA
jgi:anti-sigma factor RsiW